MPEISIIMSVFNGGKYLNEAVDSILSQSFNDFEFIIINDCSTDNTDEILKDYSSDPRIKTLTKEQNKGLLGFVENLNIGLNLAQGKYIARMDADDISSPERLKKQFEFLESHPNIFLVGSSAEKIDENGDLIGYFKAEDSEDKLKKKMLKWNYIYHPTIMFRNVSGLFYRDKFRGCEDYDFYLRSLSEGKKLINIDEPLLKYRILKTSVSRSEDTFTRNLLVEKAKEFYFKRLKGIPEEYGLLNPESLKKVLDFNYKNSEQELLFAARYAWKANNREYLSKILDKTSVFYQSSNNFYLLRFLNDMPLSISAISSLLYRKLS